MDNEQNRVGVWLFEYRGLKGTLYIQPDSAGEYDLQFDSEGEMRSSGVDALLQYGDYLADRLGDRSGSQGLVNEAVRQGGRAPAPAMPTSDESCPDCGYAARWSAPRDSRYGTGKVRFLECTNPNHKKPGTRFAFTIRSEEI